MMDLNARGLDMDELLKKAKKFLEENPTINEVELSDDGIRKVRLIRNPPSIVWVQAPLPFNLIVNPSIITPKLTVGG